MIALLWVTTDEEGGKLHEVVQTPIMKCFQITVRIFEHPDGSCTYNAKGCVFGQTKDLAKAKELIYDLLEKWYVYMKPGCPYDDNGDGDCLICVSGLHTCPMKVQ